MEQDFLGALTGTGTVEVLVENDGQEGQVEVVVELEDNHGEVVTREIESIHMEEGEQRRISVDVEVTEEVEAYEVEARAG
ncbi:hypothetical protein B1756_07815 [Natrarchaeobaculum aegyptiacum]|uniref:Uncharacterized protein n=2 Tax=Natrarchaeobaculum aegyptiacum TaxID=745377 RepID=A0A2Z2HS85_9EURY|nr:hypothetical protein B1756_07815 [Natrarchaeobaculum aegyptiacum]